MTAAPAGNAPPPGITTALYLSTKTLHVEAERSGVINDMLRGQASRAAYTLLLRNLLPVYRELEHGLDRHGASPMLATLANYKFDRTSTIETDLLALAGTDWRNLPVLPAGEIYARRVTEAAEGDGARLIAHAYTRYLGDLSGGQILRKLLARAPGLSESELTFYDWSRFPEPAVLKNAYRTSLDEAGALATDPPAIIDEGSIAFSLNTDLSWAVQTALATQAPVITPAE